MALLWMDGFDTYGATNGADISAVLAGAGYDNVGGEAATATRTGRGIGWRCWAGAASYQYSRLRRAVANNSCIITGFAVYLPSAPLTRLVIFQYDNGLGTVWNQLTVFRNTQSGISIAKQDGDGDFQLIAQSAPNILFPGVWHYVEVKYNITGSITVRVDGHNVLTAAGNYKNNSAPNIINLVQFMHSSFDWSVSQPFYPIWDDWYICNDQGSIFNDFCGDVVIHAVMPNGDHGPNELARFGGGLSNYTAVDDVPPDNDVSYLYGNTSGAIDMFTVDPLPANIIDVLAVQVSARAKKDAAGLSDIKLKCKVGSDISTSDAKPLTTAYTNKHQIFMTAPDGGAWNRSKANTMKIGIEIV